MSGKGNVVFDFVDVYGDRLDERIDVRLKHNVLSHIVQKRDHRGTQRLRITGLDSTQSGIYSVLVFPTRYQPVSQFIRVLEGKTVQQTFVLPVDHGRVIKIEPPEYDSLEDELKAALQGSSVEGNEGVQGTDLYRALDDPRKAGLLNVYTKMKTTVFDSGRDA